VVGKGFRLTNLYRGDEEREFFVWIDPANWMVENNLGKVGAFTGGPLNAGDDAPQKLPYLPNANADGPMMTPFHLGLISWYGTEYDLEVERYENFRSYPSRLHALYLLHDREEALLYARTHPKHVDGRILKRCVTVGQYSYSRHDSAWIEFLRVAHMIEDADFWAVAREYWQGKMIDSAKLTHHGRAWTHPSSPEALFYGTVNFPNKGLDQSD